MHGFILCSPEVSFVIQRWPIAYDSDLWFPVSPHKNFFWNVDVVGQWPSVRETWRILNLTELENNGIANWRPDTALWCCLTTWSQYSGESTSMHWSCTIGQTTQCNIRMSLCSCFSALCDFAQWKSLLSSPTDAQQLPRELFPTPSCSTSLQT